jgi:hypothetical protein
MNGARFRKRVVDIDMQRCPDCGGGKVKIIAAILERPVIEEIDGDWAPVGAGHKSPARTGASQLSKLAALSAS